MRIPSQRSIALALSNSSAAQASLTRYILTSSLKPAFVIDPVAPVQQRPPPLMQELRSQLPLYPVFMPADDLDYLLPPGSGAGLSDGHYASQGLADSLAPAAQTLERPDFLFDELEPLDGPYGLIPSVIAEQKRRFGKGVSAVLLRKAFRQGELQCHRDLQRWLLNWECAQFGEAALQPESRAYVDGSFLCAGPGLVVLLPVRHSWEAFAHLLWWGSQWHFPAKIAALRRWHERYGAELCCAGITTLYLQIKRRPACLEEAFELAIEHWYFARDTLVLPGISLREHARVLLGQDHWYFHQRP